MELLAAIESRSSAARLGLPAPTPEHLARILDAAAQLFRERGFDSVTVAEVMSAGR